jgi:hypothetical protein
MLLLNLNVKEKSETHVGKPVNQLFRNGRRVLTWFVLRFEKEHVLLPLFI